MPSRSGIAIGITPRLLITGQRPGRLLVWQLRRLKTLLHRPNSGRSDDRQRMAPNAVNSACGCLENEGIVGPPQRAPEKWCGPKNYIRSRQRRGLARQLAHISGDLYPLTSGRLYGEPRSPLRAGLSIEFPVNRELVDRAAVRCTVVAGKPQKYEHV